MHPRRPARVQRRRRTPPRLDRRSSSGHPVRSTRTPPGRARGRRRWRGRPRLDEARGRPPVLRGSRGGGDERRDRDRGDGGPARQPELAIGNREEPDARGQRDAACRDRERLPREDGEHGPAASTATGGIAASPVTSAGFQSPRPSTSEDIGRACAVPPRPHHRAPAERSDPGQDVLQLEGRRRPPRRRRSITLMVRKKSDSSVAIATARTASRSSTSRRATTSASTWAASALAATGCERQDCRAGA